MKVLVAGWFSFVNGHATAGDLLARDVVCEWLEGVKCRFDVALAPPFSGGVDIEKVNPETYTHVVFVCGPFQQGQLEAKLLSRFGHCRLAGLNLSMELPVERWNPFDYLLERDSSTGANPDLVFLSHEALVPVVGICLVEAYPGGMVAEANAAIDRLQKTRAMACVPIDTRLDLNSTGLRTPAEIESLLARMNCVITTRLHGTVLALKNGVPVLAIDPKAGGGKIRRQAQLIGWPVVFDVDKLEEEALRQALAYCLTNPARLEAQAASKRAHELLASKPAEFLDALKPAGSIERNFQARQTAPPDRGWMQRFLTPAPKVIAHSSPEAKTLRARLAQLLGGG